MFLKATRKSVRGKTYTNPLLVESITPKGLRHHTICSLGALEPAIRIRKATTAEPEHKAIYQVLRIPEIIIEPVRSRIVTERPRN